MRFSYRSYRSPRYIDIIHRDLFILYDRRQAKTRRLNPSLEIRPDPWKVGRLFFSYTNARIRLV